MLQTRMNVSIGVRRTRRLPRNPGLRPTGHDGSLTSPTQPPLTFAGGADQAARSAAGSRRETTRETPLPAIDTP